MDRSIEQEIVRNWSVKQIGGMALEYTYEFKGERVSIIIDMGIDMGKKGTYFEPFENDLVGNDLILLLASGQIPIRPQLYDHEAFSIPKYADLIEMLRGGSLSDDPRFKATVNRIFTAVEFANKNRSDIKSVLITYPHHDHIGAIPYISINIRLGGTEDTLQIINSIQEHKGTGKNSQYLVRKLKDEKIGDREYDLFKPFQEYEYMGAKIEFIPINHSLKAYAILFTFPSGIKHLTFWDVRPGPLTDLAIEYIKVKDEIIHELYIDATKSPDKHEPAVTSEEELEKIMEDIFKQNKKNFAYISGVRAFQRLNTIVRAAKANKKKVMVPPQLALYIYNLQTVRKERIDSFYNLVEFAQNIYKRSFTEKEVTDMYNSYIDIPDINDLVVYLTKKGSNHYVANDYKKQLRRFMFDPEDGTKSLRINKGLLPTVTFDMLNANLKRKKDQATKDSNLEELRALKIMEELGHIDISEDFKNGKYILVFTDKSQITAAVANRLFKSEDMFTYSASPPYNSAQKDQKGRLDRLLGELGSNIKTIIAHVSGHSSRLQLKNLLEKINSLGLVNRINGVHQDHSDAFYELALKSGWKRSEIKARGAEGIPFSAETGKRILPKYSMVVDKEG